MRSNVKKLLSTVLIAITLVPLLTLNVLAGYNGGGDGKTGGNEGSEYDWNQDKQGYRISIIDSTGKLVGTPVDILYSTVPGTSSIGLYTCKTESYLSRTTKNKIIYIDQLMYSIRNTKNGKYSNAPVMPKPMAWLDGPINQGEDLRQWMTKGRATITKSSGTGNSGSATTSVKPASGVTESKTKPVKGSDSASKVDYDGKIVTLSQEGSDLASKVLARATQLKAMCSQKEVITLLTRYAASLMCDIDSSSGLTSAQVKYLRNRVTAAYKIATAVSDDGGYLKYTEPNTAASSNSVTDSVSSSMFNVLSDTAFNYSNESVPLADPTSNDYDPKVDGYMPLVLASSDGGGAIFRFYDNTKNIGNPVKIIQDYKYIVLVEPIEWMQPGGYNHVVYGTITNISQWCNYMYSRGYYGHSYILNTSNVCNKVGPYCLHLTENMSLTGSKAISSIVAPSTFKVNVPVSKVSNLSLGYALHSYSDPKGNLPHTQTYDPIKGIMPHPAPDPTKIPITSSEDKRVINITKTYVDYDAEGNEHHVGTYSRTQNPLMVEVMNEDDYKVQALILSDTHLTTTTATTWGEIDGALPKPRAYDNYFGFSNEKMAAGTVVVTVTFANNTTTGDLYVKLVKKTDAEKAVTPPVPTNPAGRAEYVFKNNIWESQITKSISTLSPLTGGNWKSYDFYSTLQSAITQHTYTVFIKGSKPND